MKFRKIFSLILALSVIISLNTVAIKASESEEGVIFSEDFENMEIGSFPSKIGGQIVSYYQSASNTPQNVFEVQEDASGSKAMKFVINTKTANASTTFRIPIGQNLRSGTYEFSFDMRAENDSKYFSRFFQVWNEKDQSEIWGETAIGYFYPLGRSEQPGANFNIGGYDKNRYFKVKFVFNMDTRKYKAYVNDKQIGPETSLPRAVNSAECGLSQVVIYVNNGNFNGKGSDGTAENPGIYWVDNIKIKKNVAKVTEKYPENNSVDVDAEKPAEFVLDNVFEASTVNSDNVQLYENDVKLPKEEYTVSCSKNKLTVEKVNGGFEYNKKYSIIFSDKVAVEGAMAEIDPERLKTEFTTKSIIPDVIKDSGRYNDGYIIVMPEKENFVYTLYVVKDETETEYSGEGLEIGSYTIKIKAENTENGKTEEKIVNIEVVGPFAPTAENVRIEGLAETGATLTASFDYSDVNGDEIGECEYIWLKSDNPENGFKAIEGANGLIYQLKEDDENSYIKFAVIPVSVKEPYKGEQVFSDAFKGSFAPVANNVKVEGVAEAGETLTGSYEYFDENGDKENGTEFLWVKDSKIDGEFTEVLKNQNGKTCVIDEEDVDCYIKFCVIPKNDGKSKQDNKFYSVAVVAPFAPVAKDVKIMGTATVGQTLGASYSFFDANGDYEDKSIIEWYVDGEKVSEDEKLELKDSFKGKSVYFSVTPVSKMSPNNGKTVKSESVNIAGKKKVSYSGGGSSSGGSSPVITPVVKPDDKPQEGNKDTEKITFSDISGHWAEKTILKLAEKAIINGMGDGSFNPDGNVTRAQLAAIVSKIVTTEEFSCDFSDVSENDWYYEAVAKVSTMGIMNGDGRDFRPDDNVKREEIAVTICNILKLKGIALEESNADFQDLNEISGWAKESVQKCVQKGIVTGYSDGSFGAKKQATRAEIAVMTERLLSVLEGEANEE